MAAMKRKKKSRLSKRRGYYGYFFIFPLILGVALLFIPNLIDTFRYSVSSLEMSGHGYTATFTGFKEYKNAFTQDPYFVPYLLSNLKDFVTNVPVITIFSTFIAVLLNSRFKGRGVARLIFFIPVILSTGIISAVENSTNIINTVEAGRETVGEEGTTLAEGLSTLLMSIQLPKAVMSVISGAITGIYHVVQSSGMQIFILLTGLQSIPVSLYEAAEAEGCNRWSAFWKITFPMIGPYIRVAAVYTIVDLTARSDSVLVKYINLLAFRSNMFSLGTAMYVIYLLCVMAVVGLVLLLLNRMIKYNGEVA